MNRRALLMGLAATPAAAAHAPEPDLADGPWVIILWSCGLSEGQTATHPDAQWSEREYATRAEASACVEKEIAEFYRTGSFVLKHEVMTRARWEFERGSYHCGRSGL